MTAWSPDGKRVITGSSYDPVIRVWDVATGDEVQTMSRPESTGYRSVAWNRDGTRVLTVTLTATEQQVGSGRKIVLWNTETGKEVVVLQGHESAVNSAVWSPDDKRIASASDDRTARIWDPNTGRELTVLKEHTRAVHTVSWNHDGTQLLTASDDSTARLWSTTGTEVAVFAGHTGKVHTASWSPDSKRIATASEDKTARIWDVATGKSLYVLGPHSRELGAAVWSPERTRLLTVLHKAYSVSPEQTVRVCDAATGKELITLRGHTQGISSASWSPDGTQILTASWDKTARVWNTGPGLIRTYSAHTADIVQFYWTPDSKQIVTTSNDGNLRVWNSANGLDLGPPTQHDESIDSIVWNRDRTRRLTITSGGWSPSAVGVWNSTRSERIWAFAPGGLQTIRSATWSSDETKVVILSVQEATSKPDMTTHILDSRTGANLSRIPWQLPHKGYYPISPDGKHIAVTLGDGTIRLWEIATAKETHVIRTGEPVTDQGIKWSPDGARLASISYGNKARIWDTSTGTEFPSISLGSGSTLFVFNKDGTRLAASFGERNIRIWDVATGSEVCTLVEPIGRMSSLDFSPDGTRIATGVYNQNAQVWEAITGELLLTLGDEKTGGPIRWSPDGRQLLVVNGKRAIVYDSAR